MFPKGPAERRRRPSRSSRTATGRSRPACRSRGSGEHVPGRELSTFFTIRRSRSAISKRSRSTSRASRTASFSPARATTTSSKSRRDTAKIVEEAYKIFGELPYDNYTFIVNLRGGGGLEHLNSTALQYNRFGFKPEARYKGFLRPRRSRIFSPLQRKADPARRPRAVRLRERELHEAALGRRGRHGILLEGCCCAVPGLITDKEFLEDKANDDPAASGSAGPVRDESRRSQL